MIIYMSIFMSIAEFRRYREHRNTIAVTWWRNHRVSLRCSYASAMICAILLRSVRSIYDLTTINAVPWRLCLLGKSTLALLSGFCNALDVLATFRPGSRALIKLVSLFWILGPTLLRISSNMSGSILM